MKTDILILYEHVTRELENACLLMTALKKRGYKVTICNIYDHRKEDIHSRLIVTPHLYDDFQLEFFCNNKWHDCKCVIDLQYEQVLSKGSEDGVHNPSGRAAFAHHIAWGDLQVDRYLRHGIAPGLIHKTGHLTMDFIRSEFRPFFQSREQLSCQFGLDAGKEWVLFISSFSYVNRTETEIEMLSSLSKNARRFCELSQKSFSIVIEWIRKAAKEHPEKLFIYRPHPGEKDNQVLKALQEECPNILVISALAVKQWIIVADRIYTWYSTSIAEAYYAGKNCQILRPVPILPEQEVSIMDGAAMLTAYEDFAGSLIGTEAPFPISADAMAYAYGDGKKYAYEQLADLCERVMKDENEQHDFQFSSVKENPLKHLFWGCFVFLSKHVKAPWLPKLQNNYYYRLYRMYNKEMYGVGKLIRRYENKLTRIV